MYISLITQGFSVVFLGDLLTTLLKLVRCLSSFRIYFGGFLLGFGVSYLVTVRYATFQLAVEAMDTCVVSFP